MVRVKRMLDVEVGVPGGIGEWLACDHCGSLISPAHWEDGPCPACQMFPVGGGNTTPIPPDKLIDRIVCVCQEVMRGERTPTGKDLAAIILDEVPHVEV